MTCSRSASLYVKAVLPLFVSLRLFVFQQYFETSAIVLLQVFPSVLLIAARGPASWMIFQISSNNLIYLYLISRISMDADAVSGRRIAVNVNKK